MSNRSMNATVDPDFIRLFFPAPVQEEIALRRARRLACLIGEHVVELRPETKLGEMIEWAAQCKVDPMDFAMIFEPELRRALASFLEDSDQPTFRDMVEQLAGCFGPEVEFLK